MARTHCNCNLKTKLILTESAMMSVRHRGDSLDWDVRCWDLLYSDLLHWSLLHWDLHSATGRSFGWFDDQQCSRFSIFREHPSILRYRMFVARRHRGDSSAVQTPSLQLCWFNSLETTFRSKLAVQINREVEVHHHSRWWWDRWWKRFLSPEISDRFSSTGLNGF